MGFGDFFIVPYKTLVFIKALLIVLKNIVNYTFE
jgi:hypothetical protein